MATQPNRIVAALVALLATAALSACGDDSEVAPTTRESASDSPSVSSSESPLPDGAIPECADVWVDGATLPKDYTACTSDGETVKPVKRTCGFGAKLLEHDGRYFAMLGKPISDAGDLETNDDYQQLLSSCQA
ncbi:hypothetical protein [Nocardioides piscis]|uniref:Secreted protein n=1 Tax=Nocardioides piscis TaxID=2714938 RepID=A0A6G7YFQ4_9ACTN|nr:hypothetical protein [Nocardioides piscis]QIK75623.1 hypothetical protein G7071_09375 [Nocardioides piscis]